MNTLRKGGQVNGVGDEGVCVDNAYTRFLPCYSGAYGRQISLFMFYNTFRYTYNHTWDVWGAFGLLDTRTKKLYDVLTIKCDKLQNESVRR